MRILIVHHGVIPSVAYGGTERVIWGLGRALIELGHHVRYLVHPDSRCPFAEVIPLNTKIPLVKQLPSDVDIVHLQFIPKHPIDTTIPVVSTQHGNSGVGQALPRNTVFLSANHAARHGATCHVLNGLEWEDYGQIAPEQLKNRFDGGYFHFLGKAAWRVKNVQGAIDVALAAGQRLVVMGGNRINFKRGFRITLSPKVRFMGMIGGEAKLNALRHSRGLIFPVRWHEPFGLAVIESLYFGAPVFATPHGALPELVAPECGVLSTNGDELVDAIKHRQFDPVLCHQIAKSCFSAQRMANDYVVVYERVVSGELLNSNMPVMHESAQSLSWSAPRG